MIDDNPSQQHRDNTGNQTVPFYLLPKMKNKEVSFDLEDEEEPLTLRAACFSISFILLKHLLLSILLLMVIWSLCKLPMTDDHLRNHYHRILRHEETAISALRTGNSSVSLPPSPTSRFSTEQDEEIMFQKLKVIVVMARIIVILVIFFGILGIIKENVNLLLVFVVFMSFRLVATLYVPYFHNGMTSNAALFSITLMSVTFSIMLIHHKRQEYKKKKDISNSLPQQTHLPPPTPSSSISTVSKSPPPSLTTSCSSSTFDLRTVSQVV